MLNRLTVSALLKTVIAITSICVVIALSLTAYESWDRLQAANRISAIADASADLFKAMHNLRTDRSTTLAAAERRPSRSIPRSRGTSATCATPRCRQWHARSSCCRAWTSHDPATLVPELDRALNKLLIERAEGVLGERRQAEGPAPRGPDQGIYGDDAGPARHARQSSERSPPPSTTRTPRSTSCWRSSRSPGCCATPPAKLR